MKIVKYHLLIPILLCFSSLSFGQDIKKRDNANIDSLLQLIPVQKDSILVETYFAIFDQYIFKDPKKGQPYLDSAATIVNRLMNKYLKAELLRKRGLYTQELGDFNQSLEYLNQAKVLYNELGDQTKLRTVYNNIGIVSKDLGQTAAALEAYLTAIKISESLGEPEEERAPYLMNIGKLYSKLGNLEVSNDYYKKVEAICLEHNLEYGLAITRSNRATNLANANRFQEALELYQGAMPYFERTNRESAIGEQYNLIGAVYVKMDSLQLAKKYFLQALDLNKKIEQQKQIGIAYRNLGDVYFKEKNFNSALKNYQNSLAIANQISNNIEIVDDYLKISNTYEQLGNIAEAYDYRKIYSAMYDSIFSQENNQKINALELRYKSEKSEQEIALQKKEIALLEEQRRTANLQRIGLIIGLLTTIALFSLIYYGIRQRMNSRENRNF